VQEDAVGKLDLTFEDLGEPDLKNITRPVRAFRVGAKRGAPPSEPPAALPLPDKPSVAVLPLNNMSGDPEQEFFADGIAEDVITALSRYPSLFVIARNSCFTYKGRAVDVKQVGRELGVRYVLEGSLRKAGNRIRVTAQLVEAETGKHVWAERYDRDLADIFAVQDEITEAVTIAIAPAIAQAEQHRAIRKPPGSFDAWAAFQRGLWHLSKLNIDDIALAQKCFQQAIDLDPSFSGGYWGLARAGSLAADFHGRALPETLTSMEALARRAVALDGADAEACASLAHALRKRGDYEGGRVEAERALAISPNLAVAHYMLGATLIHTGRPKEGVAALRTCIRLDPRAPPLGSILSQVACGLYFSREYEAAVDGAKLGIRSYPDFRIITVGSLLRSASSVGSKRRRKRWRAPSRSRQARSTCMSAGACHGCGRRTTPTCSKGCARRAGKNDCRSPSRRYSRRGYRGLQLAHGCRRGRDACAAEGAPERGHGMIDADAHAYGEEMMLCSSVFLGTPWRPH
jgi:adenylate cyclase